MIRDKKEPRYAKIKISEKATIGDLITLLNEMNLEININSPNPIFQKFIYEHQDWFVDKEI